MKIDQKENISNTRITDFMPTKAQIESTTRILRKSVARWNKTQLKLNKAKEAYEKGRKKTQQGKLNYIGLRKLVDRLSKAKMEFYKAERAWTQAGNKYRKIHSQLPHGHWMK